MGIGQELLLKDFSLKLLSEERDSVFEKEPLVRVAVPNGKSTIIKKSSLCWLLEEETQRVSSDRLRRFFMRESETLPKSSKTKILPNSKKIVKKRLCTFVHSFLKEKEGKHHHLTLNLQTMIQARIQV